MFNLKSKSMRKLSLGLLTLAMAAVVFTSCKKDENAAPVIALTNIAETVSDTTVDKDNYDLTIVITSDAGLKSVKIAETVGGTSSDKLTITEFTDNSNFTKVYSVTGLTKDGKKVTITAIDKDDQTTSREITIKKKDTIVPLKTVTFAKSIGAGGNKTLGSYVDLEAGDVYGYTEVNTDAVKKAAVDAVFNLSSLFNKGNGLDAAGTGTKFGTTTLTSTTYASASASSLTALTASLDEITVEKDKIIYFVTKAGKKGLIWIKSLTAESAANANDASITIEVKLEE